MKKRFALYGMFAAMAIFVTACGDDSSSSASDPADEEYSSSIDDEESSSSEEEVSSSSTKKDGKSSSSEAKKGKSSSSEEDVSSSSTKKDGKSSSSEAKKDDKSSSSEKAKSSSSAKDDKSSSSEKAKSSSSAKDDKSSSSEKPSSSSSEPESSSSSEPESSSSEEPLVSVAPFCEVSVDEKNSEKLFLKYGVGTFSLSIAFDTGDKASVYLKRKGETCSQIMSIDGDYSYYGMPGGSCKVTDCSETDGIATYIEDCEVDKVASGMPTAAELKSSYDEFCNDGFQYIYKKVYTTALNKNMLSAGKYDVMVDMRQDASYVEGEDFRPYVYRTIQIGDQTWMAQNLNYESESGSSCYGGENNNCYEYGRLYTWEAAQTACPDGWRLPTKADFVKLIANVDSDFDETSSSFSNGEKLRTESWYEGSNEIGFSAVAGGDYYSEKYSYQGSDAYFWSQTANGESEAYVMMVSTSGEGNNLFGGSTGTTMNSVRCIKK